MTLAEKLHSAKLEFPPLHDGRFLLCKCALSIEMGDAIGIIQAEEELCSLARQDAGLTDAFALYHD